MWHTDEVDPSEYPGQKSAGVVVSGGVKEQEQKASVSWTPRQEKRRSHAHLTYCEVLHTPRCSSCADLIL